MGEKKAVLIPIYKKELNELERISLEQAKNILCNHKMIFVAPENMRGCLPGEVEYFDNSFFESIDGYNKLMLSEHFYERFLEYTYILIYQLDAFVFSDRFEEFCNMSYDYIGAPWNYGLLQYIDAEHAVIHVGNGGFSLRNTLKCMQILKKKKSELQYVDYNEDIFFSECNCDYFRVAPVEIARAFSIESEVKKNFSLNGNQLPFGCHAWQRYDMEFWATYIKKFGYDIGRLLGENEKQDDMINNEFDRMYKISYFWEKIFNIDEMKNIIENSCQMESRNIIVWGCGKIGKIMSRVFNEMGYKVVAYIDNSKEKQKKGYEGYEILSEEKIVDIYYNQIIFITVKNGREEVIDYLKKLGLKKWTNFICIDDLEKIYKEKYYSSIIMI